MHTIERILFRSMLFLIDLFLAFAPEGAAMCLWDTLGAIRGPDNHTPQDWAEQLKTNYTGPIRGAAFPITRWRERETSRDATGAWFSRWPLPEAPDKDLSHFHWHAWAAILALRGRDRTIL